MKVNSSFLFCFRISVIFVALYSATDECVIEKQCSSHNCFNELENNLSCESIIIKNQNSFFSTDYLNANFKNLTELTLLSCEFQTVNGLSLQKMTLLKMLRISNCKVDSFDFDAISPLENLKTLKTGFNNLKKIKNLLANKSKLKEFVAHYNKISKIDEDAFKTNKNLDRINMKNNLIECLDANLFRGLFNLKIVNFSSNLITSIDHRLFTDNEKLRSVDFSGNKITVVEWRTVTRLVKLEDFSLINNICINISINYSSVHLVRDKFALCTENLNETKFQTDERGLSSKQLNSEGNHMSFKTLYLIIAVLIFFLCDLTCALVFVVFQFSKYHQVFYKSHPQN